MNEEMITDAQGNIRTVVTKKTLYADKSGEKSIVGLIRDITERKRAEEALRNRDILLGAVAVAKNILLTETDTNSAINGTLELMESATGVDLVHISGIHESETSKYLLSRRFEWTRDSSKSMTRDFNLYKCLCHATMSRWHKMLSSGHLIKGLVQEFPKSERTILESQKIKTILAIPIMIEGQFWGFICFVDSHSERIWTRTRCQFFRPQLPL